MPKDPKLKFVPCVIGDEGFDRGVFEVRPDANQMFISECSVVALDEFGAGIYEIEYWQNNKGYDKERRCKVIMGGRQFWIDAHQAWTNTSVDLIIDGSRSDREGMYYEDPSVYIFSGFSDNPGTFLIGAIKNDAPLRRMAVEAYIKAVKNCRKEIE